MTQNVLKKKEGDHRIKIIECPRDAMQGLSNFIPTKKKIEYINQLLKVGFDTIDFGSFVSPAAIPQMADTAAVVDGLDMEKTQSKLLAIIANVRGAKDAAAYDRIDYLGFPFSISPTFQERNTHSTINESLERVKAIMDICGKRDKQLVIYISMAFGNPYGDKYHGDIVLEWTTQLQKSGIGIVSLADTVGIATDGQIATLVAQVTHEFPRLEMGVHLHSTDKNQANKTQAALSGGCRRFDGALKGLGGCPMAGDELVGNMKTEWMINYFKENGYETNINDHALLDAIAMASTLEIK